MKDWTSGNSEPSLTVKFVCVCVSVFINLGTIGLSIPFPLDLVAYVYAENHYSIIK